MRLPVLVVVLLGTLAIAACERADDRSAEYIERARERIAQQDYDAARLELSSAVEIDPENTEALMLQVVLAERDRDFRAMYAYLNRVLSIDPEHVGAHVRLGMIKLHAAQDSGAPALLTQVREHVATATSIEPGNPGAKVLSAALTRQDGDAEGAYASVREVLADDPVNVAAVSLLVSMLLEDGRTRDALESLDTAVATAEPEALASLMQMKVQVLRSLERWAELEAELLEMQQRFPDDRTVAYQRVNLYVQRERLDEAQAVLEALITQHPDDVTGKLRFAQFLANHRDADMAETALSGFIEQNPDLSDFRFALATLYEAVGRRAEAATAYEGIIELEESGEDAIDARTRLARLKLREGEIDVAGRLLEEVLAESPRDSEALVLRAGLALQDGELEEAIADLRDAYRTDPRSERTLALLAEALLQAGDTNLAEERLRELVKVHPGNAFGRDRLATLLASRGDLTAARAVIEASTAAPSASSVRLLVQILTRQQQFEAAREAAAPLLGDDDTRALGQFLTARAYQAEGRHEDALASFEQALELAGPNHELLSAMVISFAGAGRAEDALPLVEAFREENPERYDAYTLLGQVHLRSGRWDEARQALSRSVELRDDVWTTYRDLAGIELRNGRTEQALQVLADGLEALPDNAQLRLLLAQVQEQLGQFAAAMEQYQLVLDRDPRSVVAANNLAVLIADHDASPERLQHALALVELLSTSINPLYLDTVGWVHYRAGNLQQAVEVLERAVQSASGVVQLAGQLPQMRYHLGMAYFSTEQPDRARTELRSAVDDARPSGYTGLEEARATLALL
jgi:tetratricopeptide (TPR) repeat protein